MKTIEKLLEAMDKTKIMHLENEECHSKMEGCKI
jgi:hypothetical protein